ncbi:MAG: SDR family oxidoreductase [Candidatus Hodarchaeota archaeon]
METMGKVVIITGASRGIGKAISIKLAEKGMNVVLASRNESKLLLVKDKIDKLKNSEALIIPTDVTKEDDVKQLVEKTLAKFGTIDVLINNAGIGIFKRADEFTLKDFNQIFDVNVKGVFLLTKYVIPHMIQRKSGHVIIISSIAGKNGFKSGTLYAASKHAVMGYSWSLREDVKEFGIKVTAICPGSVLTNFGGKKPTKVEWSMDPEDIAHACDYLVSESENVNTAEIIIKPRYNPRTINWNERS